jgi:hypothetical protein
MFAALRSRLAETVSLYRSGLTTVIRLASFPVTRSGQVRGLSGGFSVAPASSSRLAFGRSLLHARSQQARGQMPPPSLGFSIKNFRALRLSVPAGWCPEDRVKVRLKRRSGNIPKLEFSTSPHIACGQEWISQRLVAFVIMRAALRERNRLQAVTLSPTSRCAERRDSLFPGAECRDQASRLRRASRRRRKPLSLMKPSASFWS